MLLCGLIVGVKIPECSAEQELFKADSITYADNLNSQKANV